MYRHHGVPLLLGHRCERLVAQDSGVGDEYMRAAKLLERDFDDRFAVLHGSNGGSRFSTSYMRAYTSTSMGSRECKLLNYTFDDLVNDSIRALLADIVDHDVRAEARVHERIRASQTLSGPRDDCCLAVVPHLWRGLCVRWKLRRVLERRLYRQGA